LVRGQVTSAPGNLLKGTTVVGRRLTLSPCQEYKGSTMFHLLRSCVRTSRGMPNRRRLRPAVEALEDRNVPSTFIVTTLSDAGPKSLREAITRANDEVNNPGGDTIVFDPAVRGGTVNLLTPTNPLVSTAAVPQPAGPSAFLVTSPITILGTGETITRAGTTAFRLFQVTAAGSLTLRNLSLNNGLAQGGDGGANGPATGGGGGGGGRGPRPGGGVLRPR